MATIIGEKKVKPITPKVETQTHDEKSFMDIIQSEEFDFYINDYIERYNSRPAPKEGCRYIRTPWDTLIDRGEFNLVPLKDHFVDIAHKASDLPASIRSAIVELFTNSISKVLKDRIIKKQKEEHGKEEGGSESANG